MSNNVLTAEQIADLVGGDLFISTDATFTGINSLAEATADEVSFLGNEKYYKDFLSTKSRLVLAPPILQEAPEGVGVIHIENPTFAFSAVITYFADQQTAIPPGISKHAHIAESATYADEIAILPGAVIGENVTIGKGTVIHSGVVIADHSTIGENSVIYQNVSIREKSVIGNNVILQPGCVIGSDGFGYENVDGKHIKIPQVGHVVIEDDVEIGANTTIDRARFGKTIISQGTKVDNQVQVAHNVIIGPHNLLVAQSGVAGSSITEEHVIIGAQSGIAGHIKIGKGLILAGQSGFTKNLDTPGVYQGLPARPITINRKIKALVNRLPRILERLKALEEKLKRLEP